MMKVYKFEDYKLRPVAESDREHCAAWIESDPDHRGRVLPGYFIMTEEEQMKQNVECLLLEDKFGEPCFYFRISRALRVDMQFGPVTTAEEKERLMNSLQEGFNWLIERSSHAGFRQVIFDSQSPTLIRFCNKRLGFQKSPDELVRDIAPPKPQESQEKGLQP